MQDSQAHKLLIEAIITIAIVLTYAQMFNMITKVQGARDSVGGGNMNGQSPGKLLDFQNRVVIVTGSGQGIGSQIARRFAEAGADVVINYRSSREGAKQTQEIVEQSGRRAITIQADVSRREDVQRLIRETITQFHRLDILINNASTYSPAPILEMSDDEWDNALNSTLRTVFLCTQAAARQMVKQGDGGAIVNVASIEALAPAPHHSHYDAAKAAVLMYTKASAMELGAHGIRVNSIAPGLIWRKGIEEDWPEGVQRYQSRAPLGRLGRADDVADACLILASPAVGWITGANLTVDGGFMTSQIT